MVESNTCLACGALVVEGPDGCNFSLFRPAGDDIAAEVRDRVGRMRAGEVICYHIGFLAVDRCSAEACHGLTGDSLDVLAESLWRLVLDDRRMEPDGAATAVGSQVGRLMQRRLGKGRYMYLFQKERGK